VRSGTKPDCTAANGEPPSALYEERTRRLGAIPREGAMVEFCVWAPLCREVAIEILHHEPAMLPLHRTEDSHFIGVAAGGAGLRYRCVLDGDRRRPDPTARSLPDGVHGPSEVVNTAAYPWTDAEWKGLPLRDLVLYELHVGAFTPEGTFDAVIPRLAALRDLGITAVELMPIASFPGSNNWGYDGVGLFAPQRTYGGPAGLQRLVNACHAQGLAVVLDVVYNHLGPEGNYLAEFGPYFTDRYSTPWGSAMNFDGEDSRGVRDFVIANALYWIGEYHIDGLRLDAIHSIFDASPTHILRELNDAVQAAARALGRVVPVMAESDLNDRRVIDPVAGGGYGLTGQWHDDFHHCLHTLLTGERHGYYADFGALDQLAKAYTDGFVYDGNFSIYRGRNRGTATRDIPGEQLVVFAQNHDQVGNRAWGDRLGALTDFEGQKLAATAILLSPFVPLLFMGEEYGELSPFLFFTDFEDPGLREAVSRGRREEFTAFGWQGEIPDPQHPATFARSKVTWALRHEEPHRRLWEYYRTLLSLRRRHPILGVEGKKNLSAQVHAEKILALLPKGDRGTRALVILSFAPQGRTISLEIPPGVWQRLLDSTDEQFGGPGVRSPSLLHVWSDCRVALDAPANGALLYLRTATRCRGETMPTL
jgi:maltooligosyltrehalose trehalohydrolase